MPHFLAMPPRLSVAIFGPLKRPRNAKTPSTTTKRKRNCVCVIIQYKLAGSFQGSELKVVKNI